MREAYCLYCNIFFVKEAIAFQGGCIINSPLNLPKMQWLLWTLHKSNCFQLLIYVFLFTVSKNEFLDQVSSFLDPESGFLGKIRKKPGTSFQTLKRPLHFREIQWGIYNISSLKCNGFFDSNFEGTSHKNKIHSCSQMQLIIIALLYRNF